MSVFETSTEDPLGLWNPAPPAALHFGVGDEPASPPEGVTVYRVNLPASLQASDQALQNSEELFRRVDAALQTVPARLDALAQREKERQQKAAAASFDTSAFEVETGPEGDLLALLQPESQSQAAPLHFGIAEDASAAWEQAKAELDSLLAQVSRELLNFAWVETKVSGLAVAQTIVNWSGDAQTAWAQGITPQQISLHSRTLRVASTSRNLKIRLFATASAGAARLTAQLSTPGGAFFALPAVYKFVLQIVQQVRELQALPA